MTDGIYTVSNNYAYTCRYDFNNILITKNKKKKNVYEVILSCIHKSFFYDKN